MRYALVFILLCLPMLLWYISKCKAAFTRDATGSATGARQPRHKNRQHRNTTGVFTRRHAACSRHATAASPGRQFEFELIIAARHMLSRAVASVFFEEHRPQKLPIHGLYAGVTRDCCLPCKSYCRAASDAAACRAPVALLVASCVDVT